MTLHHGETYRILTTAGKVFDRVKWDARDMVFTLVGGRRMDGTQRGFSLDAVTHIAQRASARASEGAGWETFAPIESWSLEA